MGAFSISAGALLLLIGSANSLLALNVETCTGGAADSLSAGVISIVLYVVAFTALGRARSAGLVLFLAAIPALIALAHTLFAARFAFGYLEHGMTSCEAMFGVPYEADGREIFHLGSWILASLVFWIGLGFAVWTARQRNLRRAS